MQVGREHRDKRPSFRELEALHALVEARKTTSAAHKIGVSQPAISRAIQDLEHRVGKALFRREGGRLVPTADGILLYQPSLTPWRDLAGAAFVIRQNRSASSLRPLSRTDSCPMSWPVSLTRSPTSVR
jgi:DNA-binding transcriptional LysR family regulator